MTTVIRGECLCCGGEITAPGIPGFEAGPIVGICHDCADQELLDEGGTILRLTERPDDAHFDLGVVRITAGAIAALEEAEQRIAPLLSQHAAGDWGEVGRLEDTEVSPEEMEGGALATAEDAKLNKIAIERGRGRVMSVYQLPTQHRLWVMTDLPGGGTEVMLSSEY